jgi:hypothetical protein
MRLVDFYKICHTAPMENLLFPSQRARAIWILWSQDNPITLTLEPRSQDDEEPYLVICGQHIDAAVLMRVTEKEANWLIHQRAGL